MVSQIDFVSLTYLFLTTACKAYKIKQKTKYLLPKKTRAKEAENLKRFSNFLYKIVVFYQEMKHVRQANQSCGALYSMYVINVLQTVVLNDATFYCIIFCIMIVDFSDDNCSDGRFNCEHGKCISFVLRCDGMPHCANGLET